MIEVENITHDYKVTLLENDKYIIRYAYGCNKTWFITKNIHSILPKGSRLLMKLYCKKTTLPLHTTENYPTVNDVIIDIDDIKLLILKSEFL